MAWEGRSGAGVEAPRASLVPRSGSKISRQSAPCSGQYSWPREGIMPAPSARCQARRTTARTSACAGRQRLRRIRRRWGNLDDCAAVPPTWKVQLGLAATISASCAIVASGQVQCWGRNQDGELGRGTTSPHESAGPISGNDTFTKIAGGGFHACAISTGGILYCWGLNDEGQLGDGTTTQRSSPVAVAGQLWGQTLFPIPRGDG